MNHISNPKPHNYPMKLLLLWISFYCKSLPSIRRRDTLENIKLCESQSQRRGQQMTVISCTNLCHCIVIRFIKQTRRRDEAWAGMHYHRSHLLIHNIFQPQADLVYCKLSSLWGGWLLLFSLYTSYLDLERSAINSSWDSNRHPRGTSTEPSLSIETRTSRSSRIPMESRNLIKLH